MIARNTEMETVKEIKERGSALKERIVKEYLAGASIWSLRNKYARLIPHSEVRRLLEGIVRPRGEPSHADPTEEEIVRERDRTKSQWSAETASKRWVGRYLSSPETLGEALSKALNQVDRSYR